MRTSANSIESKANLAILIRRRFRNFTVVKSCHQNGRNLIALLLLQNIGCSSPL